MNGTKDDTEANTNDNLIVTILKPTSNEDGVKVRRMRVIIKFFCKVTGARLFEDDNIFQLISPMGQSDVGWFKDNVFRFVDLDATVNAADARADKLVETYYLKDTDKSHDVALDLVIFKAKEMYLKVSMWGGAIDQ